MPTAALADHGDGPHENDAHSYSVAGEKRQNPSAPEDDTNDAAGNIRKSMVGLNPAPTASAGSRKNGLSRSARRATR